MTKFEIGKSYMMRSACDHECIWTYTVTHRTASTITISDGKKVKRCRIIKTYTDDAEAVLPLGRFSMAPVLRAKNEIA